MIVQFVAYKVIVNMKLKHLYSAYHIVDWIFKSGSYLGLPCGLSVNQVQPPYGSSHIHNITLRESNIYCKIRKNYSIVADFLLNKPE